MLAVLYFSVYIAAGIFITRCLLPQKNVVVRVWLGSCLGILLLMWLPAIMAFMVAFSILGHIIALVLLLALVAAAYYFRDKTKILCYNQQDKRLIKYLIALALPLSILAVYLSFTHYIMAASDGSLHVGQSTFGDLPLHLSIITSMRNAKFPADYSIFPGVKLGYPFLANTLSTTFMLFGCSLRTAILIPNTAMLVLLFSGYLIFCDKVLGKRKGLALAVLLFFINGGLGFFYLLDMQGVALGQQGLNQLQAAPSLMQRINNVLQGWYQTPVNHAEFTTYNLRWSNVIADMIIPQRTTLAGWVMLIPCLYLMYDFAYKQIKLLQQNTPQKEYKVPYRKIAILGLFAGALPMVNTHAFLALILVSFGFMFYTAFYAIKQKNFKVITPFLIYAAIAAALALPQLFLWTFSQTMGSESFMRFRFNWVNNLNGQGMQDGYFWFYIKNVGLPFVLILLAVLEKDTKRRFLASGAFSVYIVAELFLFQPNEYDNNKLFYVWYMLCAIIAADYAMVLLEKLKPLRSRIVIAVICCFMFFTSGALSIARECVSNFEMFGAEHVQAAEFVEENTDINSVFMAYTQHINPISALTGRKVVCGPSNYLSLHGLNISSRENDLKQFYQDPVNNKNILEKYNADYIMVSDYEMGSIAINIDDFKNNFELVFTSENSKVFIFKV